MPRRGCSLSSFLSTVAPFGLDINATIRPLLVVPVTPTKVKLRYNRPIYTHPTTTGLSPAKRALLDQLYAKKKARR